MDVERERRWNELLVAALDVEPQQRPALLKKLEPDDKTLVREILASLADDEGLDGFLSRPGELVSVTDAIAAAPPLKVPGHRILERLGAGGMGEVYRAEQEEPVRRSVALKCIQAHLPREAQKRFLAEREALARLNHRSIARFFDAGTTDDGRPWLTMELLDGQPLNRYCDHRRLSVEARLRLFVAICAGLEHAHRRQILHRDLKPSNVLVVEEDDQPIPKIIDFGIAKLLDASPELRTHATHGGHLGTPAYMSPEALTDGRSVDTRTDVYSLGVLLYELLVGRRPFDTDSPGLGELVRRVREDEPENPATAIGELADDERTEVGRLRDTSPSTLQRLLGSDLRWILNRALEKDPDLRYGSVRELADDLQRVLDDRPIKARPPTTVYRLRKLFRRRRGAVVAAGIALFGLTAGAIGSTLGFLRASEEARHAREALLEARAVSDYLVGLFQGADPTAEDGTDLSVGELLDRGADGIDERLVEYPVARGRLLRTLADVYMERGSYDRAEEMLREAVPLLDSALPPDDPERASVLGSLGVLHSRRGEWTEAETAFAQAVAAIDVEADPEDWALKRHNLGAVIYRQRRLDEAEEHYLAALEVRRRHLPPDHPHFARSYNALGALMMSYNRYDEAAEYLYDAVAHNERTLGGDHPNLAKALVNLARAHSGRGRYSEARELITRALRIEEAALGPEHPDLALTSRNLAEIDGLIGNLETAEATWRRVVEIQHHSGADDIRFARDLVNLAYLVLEAGRLDEAETLFQEAAEIHTRVTDALDPNATTPRLGLAAVAWKRGQLDLAEREATEVRTLRDAFVGKGRWLPASELWVLAGALHDRGDTEQAAVHARRLIELWRGRSPTTWWLVLRIREDMEGLVAAAGED